MNELIIPYCICVSFCVFFVLHSELLILESLGQHLIEEAPTEL